MPGPQVPFVHWEPTFPVEVAVAVMDHAPSKDVPASIGNMILVLFEELQLVAKTIKPKLKKRFIVLPFLHSERLARVI